MSAANALIERLRSEEDFEGAARLLLRVLLEALQRSMRQQATKGRIMRAIFHLRSVPGYEALVVEELEPDCAPASLHSSMTAWRQLQELKAPVALDVFDGAVQPLSRKTRRPSQKLSEQTQQLLMAQDASHIYALPAYSTSGELQAMVSVELLYGMEALGQPDTLWPAVGEQLQLLTNVAAPVIMSRPYRPREEALVDARLPVVGDQTAAVIDTLRKFARFEETILLQGETGVGKTQLAAWVHARSSREHRPMEAVHLQSIPEDLIAGELFGWAPGAHSTAARGRTGLVARASGGTLFLDEIDRLPLSVQDRLLLLLDSKTYRVLGDDGPARQADVRFIIATNANLEDAVAAGTFRQDLYYRISTLPVEIPPLRRRRDEIPGWAAFFCAEMHAQYSHPGKTILSAPAEALLSRHGWPGNLRQLRQVLQRAWILSQDPSQPGVVLDAADIQAAMRGRARALPSVLREAAASFLDEIELRRGGARPLTLDDAALLGAYVLEEAVERHGKREAFVVLGKEKLLRNRNHSAACRRERERIAAFEALLRGS